MKIKHVLQKLPKKWLKSTAKATQKLGRNSVFSSLLFYPSPEDPGADQSRRQMGMTTCTARKGREGLQRMGH